MYNENKGFSLISIIVKIIIIVIFILLAIWLISKVVNKTSNSTFEKNMNVMKEASIEYFKKGNLPEEEGTEKKVTLGDLIKMKYISSFDKKCDREKSYSQATLVDDYYALRVELLCGNKKDYIYTSIDKNGNCVGDNCKKETKTEEKKDNNKNETANKNNTKVENDSSAKNNNKNNNSNDKNNKNNGKTLYYEFIKVDKVYSDWSTTKIEGTNVETKEESRTVNKYCQIYSSDYYVVSYYPTSTSLGNTYRTVIRLDNISANTSYYSIVTSELFNDNLSLYKNLLNEPVKTTFVVGDNGYKILNNPHALMLSSLKNENASITNNLIYSNNGIFVETWVKFNNYNNLYKYAGNVDMYFVPIHYVIKYADESSCIKDLSSNASNYNGYEVVGQETSNVTLYRSYTIKKDNNNIKWSTNKTMEGYEPTGKTEYR